MLTWFLISMKTYQVVVGYQYQRRTAPVSLSRSSLHAVIDWDDDNTMLGREAYLPHLDLVAMSKLEESLSTMISTAAINTVSYYMLEAS